MGRRGTYHTLIGVASKVGPTALASLISLGCYPHGESTCSQEESSRAPLRGDVVVKYQQESAGDAGGEAASSDAGGDVDGRSGPIETLRPGAGSLVFVELCDLYSENPDPAKGHPNYRYVGLADNDGNFKIDVPKGTVGLHTLLEGYLYGSKLVSDSTSSNIHVTAEALSGRPVPKATNFVVTPTDVVQGSTLLFSLKIQAATNDPISDEVLLAEPTSGLARAFDPPRRGRPGRGFPDGLWTLSLAAPPPGSYTYYAQAVSEQCVVSTRLSVQVIVR